MTPIFCNIHFVVPVKVGIINQINLWININTSIYSGRQWKLLRYIVPSNLHNVSSLPGTCAHLYIESWFKCLHFLFVSTSNQFRVSAQRPAVLINTVRGFCQSLRKIPEYAST